MSSGGNDDLTWASSWTSSNANIATVLNGRVSGVDTGTATISATYNYFGIIYGASATVNVTTERAPPRISANVSPAPNSAGFINQNAVVTFTCIPGGWPIASCTSPVTVSTEGRDQVVTGTVTDTGGVSVSLNATVSVDKSRPLLDVASPVDGATVGSSSVTVTGTVSDTLAGVTQVVCNQQSWPIVDGAFSCSVGLAIGVNTTIVSATDYSGNVSSRVLHIHRTGTLPAPTLIRITPASITMLVGDSRRLIAVDEFSRPRPDATWSVDNASIATVIGGASVELTALSGGTATVTAIVQDATATALVDVVALVSWHQEPSYGPLR